MQDNNQNNWKILLESPGSFHDEIIRDKNGAWEKLYSRLHKKTPRKIVAWYWAAAALITITISAVTLFVNKEKTHNASVGLSSPTKKQTPVAAESSLNTEKKNSKYVLSQSKQNGNTAVSIQKTAFVKRNPSTNKQLVADSIIKQLPPIVITPTMVNDTAIKTAAATGPVKKKLRVVHLNEIGQSVDEPLVNSRYTEKHGFDLRIINGEIYNPVNSSSSINGLILTKPRNTSN